ncbi:MAG: hypothetical protein ABIT96_00005 [Ferruginibacter sp.]
MKKIIFPLLALAGIILLASCSTPFFTSANDMRGITGNIELKDGSTVSGQITSSLSRSYTSNPYIDINETGGKKRRIFINDIKGMNVRNNYYEPKSIDQGWGSPDQVLLVKRLTKDDSRIQLYELYEQSTRYNNNPRYGSSSQVEDNYSYYISLPGQDPYQAWNVEGKHLTPNFEDKMSEFVKDCPALADKIKRKEKGYFYAKISLISEKRLETLMNIIQEYNDCKK